MENLQRYHVYDPAFNRNAYSERKRVLRQLFGEAFYVALFFRFSNSSTCYVKIQFLVKEKHPALFTKYKLVNSVWGINGC
jgi:hypothetical protein